MHALFPGSFVLSLEHNLKLHKGVNIVKVDLFGPLLKFGDGLVHGEFGAKFPIVWVDFSFDLTLRIIAL
jgi:hypothetical protein